LARYQRSEEDVSAHSLQLERHFRRLGEADPLDDVGVLVAVLLRRQALDLLLLLDVLPKKPLLHFIFICFCKSFFFSTYCHKIFFGKQQNRLRHRVVVIRVTRLGENSPIGRLFHMGSFLKNPKVAQILGLLFPRYKLCIHFDKKLAGPRIRRFFRKLIWSPWW
jgi:hypothetical protein